MKNKVKCGAIIAGAGAIGVLGAIAVLENHRARRETPRRSITHDGTYRPYREGRSSSRDYQHYERQIHSYESESDYTSDEFEAECFDNRRPQIRGAYSDRLPVYRPPTRMRYSTGDVPLVRSADAQYDDSSMEIEEVDDDPSLNDDQSVKSTVENPTSQAVVLASVVSGQQPEDTFGAVNGTPPEWVWDDSKDQYFYEVPERRLRVYQDGREEQLAPPPVASAPQWVWDQGRNDYFFRNETEQCWQYRNGRKIKYGKRD